MAGIRVIERDGKAVLHQTVWVDPDEVPTFFLVVKDGATALAHPDYVGETLHSVNEGDLDLRDAWDKLLIMTPAMEYPQPCEILADTLDTITVLVNGESVYRLTY